MRIVTLIVVVALAGLTGCASIVNGQNQSISVETRSDSGGQVSRDRKGRSLGGWVARCGARCLGERLESGPQGAPIADDIRCDTPTVKGLPWIDAPRVNILWKMHVQCAPGPPTLGTTTTIGETWWSTC